MSNQVRLQLLTEVANKTLSLQDMYKKAKRIKQLQQLRLLIKTYLHVETFEKALEQHPNVLHESKLEKYLVYSLHTLPTELKVSIAAMKLSMDEWNYVSRISFLFLSPFTNADNQVQDKLNKFSVFLFSPVLVRGIC